MRSNGSSVLLVGLSQCVRELPVIQFCLLHAGLFEKSSPFSVCVGETHEINFGFSDHHTLRRYFKTQIQPYLCRFASV